PFYSFPRDSFPRGGKIPLFSYSNTRSPRFQDQKATNPFQREDRNQDQQGDEDDGPPRRPVQIVGGREPAQYGHLGKQQGIQDRPPKAARNLQGGGDGKGHQGGNQQNADNADRSGDGEGHRQKEHKVDQPVGNPRHHRAFLVEREGKQLLVEEKDHGQHQRGHREDPAQLVLPDGQDAPEQVTGHVDVKPVGGADQDHAEGDASGEDHRYGQLLVSPVEAAQLFHEHRASDGKNHPHMERVHMLKNGDVFLQQQPGGHSGQGDVGQGVRDQRKSADHQKDPHQRGNQADHKPRQHRPPHEIVTEDHLPHPVRAFPRSPLSRNAKLKPGSLPPRRAEK